MLSPGLERLPKRMLVAVIVPEHTLGQVDRGVIAVESWQGRCSRIIQNRFDGCALTVRVR